MSTNNTVANGARLDDCHSTIFSLADLSGIKWHKFSSAEVGLADDPVLTAFTKCLSLDILAVWRRSPKKNNHNQPTTLQDIFEKELWIFWWGEEPYVDKIAQQRGLRDEVGGCWEEGLTYECRTLLFKAIHNLVERCLLNENFVRIGRWFVKPLCKEADEDISDRFSFSFSFFLHGESSLCTTVEVAKHQNLERLTYQHIQQVNSTNNPNSVILAPYGLRAKLTGVVYRSPHDYTVKKLLEEWKPFYPLGNADDVTMDDGCSDEEIDDQIPFPPVVEVVLCGIHMNYPSHFVLVPVPEGSTSFTQLTNPGLKSDPTQDRGSQLVNRNAFTHEKSMDSGNDGSMCCSTPVKTKMPCAVHKKHSTCNRLSHISSSLVDRVRVKSKLSNPDLPISGPNRISPMNIKPDMDSMALDSKPTELIADSKPVLKPWTFSDSFKNARKGACSAPVESPFDMRKSSKLERQQRLSSSAFHRKFSAGGTTLGNTENFSFSAATTNARTPVAGNQLPDCVDYPSMCTQTFVPPQVIPSPMPSLLPSQNEKMLSNKQNIPGELSDKLLARPFVTLGNVMEPWPNIPTQPVQEVVSHIPQVDLESSVEIQRMVGEWNSYRLPSNGTQKPVASSKRPSLACDSLDPSQNVMSAKCSMNTPSLYFGALKKKVKVEMPEDPEPKCSGEGKLHEMQHILVKQEAVKNHIPRQVTVGPVKELAGMAVPSDPYAFDDEADDTLTTSLKKSQSPWTSHSTWTPTPSSINSRMKSSEVKQEPATGFGGRQSELEALLTQHSYSPVGHHAVNTATSTTFGTRTSTNLGKSLKRQTDLEFSMEDLNSMFDDDDDEGGAPTPPDDPDDNHPIIVPSSVAVANSYGVSDLQHMFPTPPSLESCHTFSPEGRTVSSGLSTQTSGAIVSDQTVATNGLDHTVPTYYNRHIEADSGMNLPLHLASPQVQETPVPLKYSRMVKHPASVLYKPISIAPLPLHNHSYTPSWEAATRISPVTVPPPYAASTSDMLSYQPLTPATPMMSGVTPNTPGHSSVRTPASVPLPSPAPVPTPRTPGRGGIRSVDPIESPMSSFATPNSQVAVKGLYVDQSGNAGIFMNLLLSDSLFNLFWDHSFDQCALCVCNTNIHGADVEMGYLPALSGHEARYKCTCGFSAIRNRVSSIGTGLFLEDELEIVGARYENAILQSRKENYSPSRPPVAEAIVKLALEYSSSPFTLPTNCKRKYSDELHIGDNENVVTRRDEYEVFAQALSTSLSMMEPPIKVDADAIVNPIHSWKKSQQDALTCASTSDIHRLLVSLKPVLQDAIQKKRTTRSFGTTQHVKGPLTWREFCKEAGKNAEPQPIPSFIVGYDQDWLSVSPQALKYWEKLYLEPYSSQRDVVYVVVSPENDTVISSAKLFFKELSSSYESYRLGRLKPYNRAFKDAGILRVGVNTPVLSDSSVDEEFQRYKNSVKSQKKNGMSERNLENLILYAQACIQSVGAVLKGEQSLDLSSLYMRESRSRMPLQATTNAVPNQQSGRITPSHSHNNTATPGHNPMQRNIPNSQQPQAAANRAKESRTQYPTPYDASSAASIVIYLLDPFEGALSRGLWQCFLSLRNALPEPIKNHVFLQVVPVESVLQASSSQTRQSLVHILSSISFSTFAQCRKTVSSQINVRTMTGFGPKVADKEARTKLTNNESLSVYTPPYVLSLPFDRTSESSIIRKQDADHNILFVSYCLSHNQRWVLASATDQRGEILETCCVNIDVPPWRLSMARKQRVSVRSEAIRKLWKFCISTSSRLSTKSWRFVIGKLGRLSHGEIRDWAKYLNRKNLLASGKRGNCAQCRLQQNPEASSVVSACLTSLEPDGALRIMPDVVQPNNFGRSTMNVSQTTQLKTPEDISCTHIYVFPTSAVTQLPRSNFQADNEEDPLLDQPDADILPDVLGDFEDEEIVDIMNFGAFMDPLSLGTNDPHFPIGDDDVVKPPTTERLLSTTVASSEDASLSQQPLALGYLVSTAPAGPLPSWFWARCPYARTRCPLFLRFALHIQATASESSSTLEKNNELHPLDSTKTAVVLRFVLENYNALSWLTRDPVSKDRRSCLPVHCLALMQLYQTIQNLA
ncbi:mediator of RNA polymerase II transcription subunit 13-like isoform X2 [Clavelina lepadiformis]|uniref:mediator of RNA polymerase II transcription subunit 13-like isoform X2 n=1 Tax=Clavelina lepadiformis TaxID=159417 RepID=UPI004042DEC2